MNLLLILSAAMLCWVVILVKADHSSDAAWAEIQRKHPSKINRLANIGKRRKNFDKTNGRIESHNRNPKRTFEMGHNQFSDMKQYLYQIPLSPPVANNKTHSLDYADFTRQSFPDPVDYRCHKCMLPVKNQSICGSCWAFSATAPIEFRKCVLSGNPPVTLSEQQLIDCTTYNSGCSGGNHVFAWIYLFLAGGQTTEALYPYTAINGKCKFNATVPPTMVGAKIAITYPVVVQFNSDISTNVLNIANAVANGHLVSVAFEIVESFYYYQSGVLTDPTNSCKNRTAILGSHGGTIVGFGTLNGLDYWILRNSWTAYWGMGGYAYIQRGVNLCQIETYAAMVNVQP